VSVVQLVGGLGVPLIFSDKSEPCMQTRKIYCVYIANELNVIIIEFSYSWQWLLNSGKILITQAN